MTVPTLLLDATLAVVLGGLYVFVGRTFGQRPVSTPESRQARQAFTLWWYALAAITFVEAARTVLAAFGVLDLRLHAALAYLGLPLLALALWGLVYYLLFIYTGTARWRRASMAGHAALGAFLVGLVAWMRPEGVTAGDWTAPLAYAHTLEGPLLLAVATLLLAPVLAVASSYLSLALWVDDRIARARILTVSGAFLLWFGSAALASGFGWTGWYWWPLVARGIALGSTLLVLLAYQPAFPGLVRGRALQGPPPGGVDEVRGPRFLPVGSRPHARHRAHAWPLPARARVLPPGDARRRGVRARRQPGTCA
jgi:hypothetical protein